MKKKFSIVLAAILVVCTCAIALVACAPKNPDPFTAVDSSSALNDLWDSWAKKNMNITGNTLGIDAKIDLKNSDADLSVALQGGISQDEKNDVLRLAIANNKKTGDNKNIVDIIINSADGLFINIDGLSNKPIKVEEIKLPSIGDLLNGMGMSIGSLSEIVKPAVVELINSSLDSTKVVVDPVKNGKKYDVTYTFTAEVGKIVDAIIEIAVTGDIAPETEAVIDEVKNIVGDINLKFTAKTTGNDRIKVKKPAKGAPKYDYNGGELTELKIDVAGMDVNATGISLGNSIPAITIPTDTISLDKALLTSRLNGNITLKDSNGASVGDYTYTINLDFEPIQLITTISDCVAQQSADPIIKKMLLDQKGKIYINVDHKCGETCKVNHIAGDKTKNGSLVSIAFSPEDFGNRRVYVSADLRTIITTDLLHALDIWGVDGIIKGQLKESQYQFSFDFIEYLDVVKMRAETPVTPDETLSIETMGLGLVSDTPFSIGNMISGIVKGFENEQELQIKVGDVISILDEYIRPLLKENDPEEGTYWTIRKAINGLFAGVNTLTIDAVYTNGEAFEQNVLELYTKDKAFDAEGKNHKVITGVPTWDKDKAGNVKIYQDKNGVANKYIYKDDGEYANTTYEIWTDIINKQADYTNSLVKVQIANTVDETPQDVYMNIIDIVGLKNNVFGTAQDVKLVLSAGADVIKNGGIGSNINNLLDSLKNLLKMGGSFIQGDMTPIIAVLETLIPPEIIIPTQITISEVESVVWDQSKVAGISQTEIFDEDPEKVYNRNDSLSDKNHIIITFADKTIVETDITASNTSELIKSNKINAWGTFTMKFSAYGYKKELVVNMDDSIGTDEQSIPLILNEGSVSYKVSNSIKNNKINANMKLDENETFEVISAFANANGFTFESTSGILGWTGFNITFNKKGTFKLSVQGINRATINYTFIVTDDHAVENLYVGMTKEYEGSIAGHEVTKTAVENAILSSTDMTVNVTGEEENPKISITFAKQATYKLTLLDKNNNYFVVTYDVKNASKTIYSLELIKENSINLKEQFSDINFTEEEINKAITKFNTDYVNKAQITFNDDLENPIFIVKANEVLSGGYKIYLVGTENEQVTLGFSFNANKVKTSGVIDSQVNVKMSEMGGISYTKEEIDTIVANWNKNTTNAGKMTVVVEEDLSLTFTLKKVSAAGHTFKVTNKCDITIVVTAAEA